MTAETAALRLYYDGHCPLCRNFVRLHRLRAGVGEVALIDVREHLDAARRFRAEGLDVDQGMVVEYGGRRLHGADALHLLALLGSRAGAFNRLNARLFRHRRLAGACYPLLRAGRNLALRLTGRRRLAESL